jgi:hypothetical protein
MRNTSIKYYYLSKISPGFIDSIKALIVAISQQGKNAPWNWFVCGPGMFEGMSWIFWTHWRIPHAILFRIIGSPGEIRTGSITAQVFCHWANLVRRWISTHVNETLVIDACSNDAVSEHLSGRIFVGRGSVKHELTRKSMVEEKNLNNHLRSQYTGTWRCTLLRDITIQCWILPTRLIRSRFTLYKADNINDVMVKRKFSRPFWDSNSDSSVVQPGLVTG